MRFLLVFLTACSLVRVATETPSDVLGKGTVCRPINEGREMCLDEHDNYWDCRFTAGNGWTCYSDNDE